MDKKGEIEELSKIIKPDVGVITNISHAHIKNFKNIIVPDDIIEKILKNVYQKLGIKDLKTFKEY